MVNNWELIEENNRLALMSLFTNQIPNKEVLIELLQTNAKLLQRQRKCKCNDNSNSSESTKQSLLTSPSLSLSSSSSFNCSTPSVVRNSISSPSSIKKSQLPLFSPPFLSPPPPSSSLLLPPSSYRFDQHWFNQVPPVNSILNFLHHHQPTSRGYQSMLSKPGVGAGRSNERQYQKGRGVLLNNLKHRAKYMENRMEREKASGNFTCFPTTITHYYGDEFDSILFSSQFSCAGTLSDASFECPHIYDLSLNLKLEANVSLADQLDSIRFDHLIGCVSLKDRIPAQLKSYHHLIPLDRQAAYKQLSHHFLLHLWFSPTADKLFGWPSNLFARCKSCDSKMTKLFGHARDKLKERWNWKEGEEEDASIVGEIEGEPSHSEFDDSDDIDSADEQSNQESRNSSRQEDERQDSDGDDHKENPAEEGYLPISLDLSPSLQIQNTPISSRLSNTSNSHTPLHIQFESLSLHRSRTSSASIISTRQSSARPDFSSIYRSSAEKTLEKPRESEEKNNFATTVEEGLCSDGKKKGEREFCDICRVFIMKRNFVMHCDSFTHQKKADAWAEKQRIRVENQKVAKQFKMKLSINS